MKSRRTEQVWPHGGSPVGLGAGLHFVAGSARSPDYYLYLPRKPAGHEQVLVSVHGVSRNALEHVELLHRFADRYGVVLVAPLFTAEAFPDYQRLGRKGRGPRADLALIRVLNEIDMTTGIDTGKVAMFGFSGGAQFVHRFAYAHSQRVRSAVLGSAGWYTMPDPSLSYPYGTADARGLDAVRFNVAAAARVPTLVVVGGDDDREDDEELNRSRIVLQSQGRHRLERARAWTAAMSAVARQQRTPRGAELVVLPGVGHSFRDAVLEGGLGHRLFEHCCKAAPTSEQQSSTDKTTSTPNSVASHWLREAMQ